MQLKTLAQVAKDTIAKWRGYMIQVIEPSTEFEITVLPYQYLDTVFVNLIHQDRQDTIAAVIEMVGGMEKSVNQLDLEVNDITELQKSGYNQALTDIITKLQALSPKE